MLVFLIVVWFVVAKKFPWYSESFPEDQVGRGCADVGLYCRADREECAGKAPEPLLGFVVCQGVKCGYTEDPQDVMLLTPRDVC